MNSGQPFKRLWLICALLIIITLFLVVFGISKRSINETNLKDWTEKRSVVIVNLISPQLTTNDSKLDLPGRLEAYSKAPLYSRVSGYLKSWKADIGDHVKAGQLLAEIETPDIDQQLLQAQADLANAQANVTLSETSAHRWQSMLSSNSVSRQEVDEKVSDFASKQALVKSAQANLDRISAMKAFTRIVAPFDGQITARNTDIGALINVGSGSDAPLFEVSDTKKLRLYVNVPQNYIGSVKIGSKAEIRIPEHPDKTYYAKVSSTSNSIDVTSGTVLVQLLIDNENNELLAGGFANVSMNIPPKGNLFSVPASSLIFNKSGLHVAIVGEDKKVIMRAVTVGQDFGNSIQLTSGILPSDKIVENPPDGLKDGDVVDVVDVKPSNKKS